MRNLTNHRLQNNKLNKQKKKQITVKTIFIFKEKRKKGDNLIYILNAYSKTKQKTLDTNN